jgi:hypothetical protein
LVGQLDSIIESCRKGEISQPQAVSSIFDRLRYDERTTDPDKEKTAQLYLSTLQHIDNKRRRDGNRLPDVIRRSEPTRSSGSVSHPSLVRATDHSKSNPKTGDDDSDSDGQTYSDDETISKRRKIDQTKLPWYRDELRKDSNPSCLETNRLLEYYERDIKQCKSWIRRAPGSPLGFPSSQWEHILRGEPVDLNAVFSNLHRIEPPKESSGHVGSTQIRLVIAEPKKKIETSGDWNTAFNKLLRAVVFAFPHRESELRAYADHIEDLFAAKQPSIHSRIIMYDNAVRSEVGGGEQILLTDFHCFEKFSHSILLSDGREAKISNSTQRPSQKSDICNRFNSAVGCPNTDNDCRYRHTCRLCKRSGHNAQTCERK